VRAVALSGPLWIVSSRTGHLWDALRRPCDWAGFADVTFGNEVFRDLVLARIIEPSRELGSLRAYWRGGCHRDPPTAGSSRGYGSLRTRKLAPSSRALYDVSRLYFRSIPVTGSGSRG